MQWTMTASSCAPRLRPPPSGWGRGREGVLKGGGACQWRSNTIVLRGTLGTRLVPQGGVVSERATDASTTAGSSGSASDARSPLERFRTKPKKPLSVTDLVSPAWCELQYFYALSKFGRKPRTAAMKTGSRIHQALEEQVHKIVPVQVQSKEDRFGLRIWNTIQGLRTLRETGLTRELDVWGVVNGEVVNGVIDEVSYTCHDPEFKERVEGRKAEKSKDTVGPGQLRLDEVFSRVGKSEQMSAWLRAPTPARDVYISDVKTRGVRSVPAGASLRPTWMQLMLYRKLLESLSSNTVDAETVLERYSLSPLKTFTEVFMFEIGRLSAVGDGETVLGDEAPHNALQGSEVESHPNLLSLWSLMITEFQHSITSINDILRAEFRYSKTGDVIGSALTVYDTKSIEEYLGSEMQWWKGEREAKGVAIEEAFKCRVCDFAEECSWRKNKIEEATEKHRLRARSRGKSAV
ncbi:exonuclease V a 5' deoxyribonuclease-domain-containing protein [Massariosphaeria phaeospora]|uniref:Exonuclease V a 5' deoxyribonuclease-domain-containing protein n=1 Tax=Massariosphaeria phaeospora TaxID=100035 RepID=A0A7C8MH78_9PLEO|nr:exonuclease V a 5' deoxyribonuclease-domain-containing protein [Massariosphaeria phaeospora]